MNLTPNIYPEHSIPASPWHPKHLAARLLGQALIFWSSSWGETCETHGIWVVKKMVDFYGGVFHGRNVFFVDLGCNLKIFVWYYGFNDLRQLYSLRRYFFFHSIHLKFHLLGWE